MNAFLESLKLWLVDFFVLTSVLLAASLALRLVVRGPAARVSLAWGAWLGIAAIAVLTALPAWPRYAVDDLAYAFSKPTTPAIHQQPEANLPPVDFPVDIVALAEPIAVLPSVVAADPSTDQPDKPATAEIPWLLIWVCAWLGSVAVGLAWILLGHWRTRRLLATANAAPPWVHCEFQQIGGHSERQVKPKATKETKTEASVSPSLTSFPSVQKRSSARTTGLWSSDRVTSAVAMGARSPQIVLPKSSIAEDNRPAVRAALAHEWAHIRHGDLWLLALERTLLPLVAVHPLFWWLRRSVRLDQELLADAAAAGEEPVVYAEALLAWAKSAQATDQSPRHGLAAVGMWENPSTLSRRVAMLVDSKRPLARPLGRGWTVILASAVAALVLGLSLVSLRPLPAQEDAARPAPAVSEADEFPVQAIRKNREAPGPVPAATRHTMPVTQIHMNVLIMSVDRAKLEGAETSLEDEIAAATESRCRKEAGLVVSDIQPEEVVKLLEALKKHKAVEIVSRPQIITLDGREAMVHVGGEAPLLRVEETINGKHEERIEYKEFGTILMLRPKLDANEKEEFVRLDIVAEQSSLIPPGEKAGAFEKEPGAVPRDVPGLVSHKFKLTSDVKLGGSLLVAESPPNKKHLRDAVKQQFLLIVTPQRAVREAVAVYADPREGDKGEAARKETEAALEAATAAEPEPGTAAAALLKRERDLRAKETAELRQQIEALTSDLQALRAATGHKVMTRVFPVQNRRPENIASDLQKLFAPTPAKDRIQISGDGKTITIQGNELILLECEKLIVALDRSGPDIDPKDPNAEHVRTVWKLLAERRRQAAEPIVELKDDVQFFPPGPTELTKSWEVRSFRLKLTTAEEARKRFNAAYSKSPLATRKITANFKGDLVEVHAPEGLMDEVRKLLEPLGAEEIAGATHTDDPAAAPKITTVFRLRHTEAMSVLQKIGQLMKKEAANAVTMVPDGDSNALIVSAPESYSAELRELIQMLDKPATDPTRSADRQLLELDLAQAKLEVEKAEHDFARLQQLAANKAVSQTEVDAARFALAAAQIQVRKAATKLEGGPALTTPPATAPPAAPETPVPSSATEVKLLELDLAEAKLDLEDAEQQFARVSEIAKRGPGSVTEQEVRMQQLRVERAKIQVQRIMVKLEGAQEGAGGARR